MHKVVLEVKDRDELENVAAKLVSLNCRSKVNDLITSQKRDNVSFHLWVEQPENYPTCLATKPYLKQDAPAALKRCATPNCPPDDLLAGCGCAPEPSLLDWRRDDERPSTLTAEESRQFIRVCQSRPEFVFF